MNDQGQNLAEAKDGLPTVQKGASLAVLADCTVAAALLLVQKESANPTVLDALAAVPGNSATDLVPSGVVISSPAISFDTPSATADSPDVSSVANSILEA